MKGIKNKVTVKLAALVLVVLAMTSAASAREVITIKQANGGNYNVTAYNTATRSYYFINGSLSSDSHQITVPNGYACTITVTLGRAVGDRNLYEEQDPLNPIFEVSKKSTYILELKRVGTGAGVTTNNAMGLPGLGNDGGGVRQPPPGQ